MTSHAYTEDFLVEQPAIQLFAALGWQTLSAIEEIFGLGGTLGRGTKSEVVLEPRLRAALERLNPGLPPEAITTAIDDLTRDRSAMIPAAANREVYTLLKEGIPFLLVSQVTITGRPAPELSPEERAEVKKVAHELLERLKELLVLDWRQKSSARSQVKLAIEELLDHGLPRVYFARPVPAEMLGGV